MGSLFFTGLVLLIIMIFVLKDKVDEYSYFKLENEKLYTQIEENRKNLEEKNLELENISEKITEIERLMGEDSIANSVNLNEIERLDLTKLNIIDKKYLLQMIPNGNPVSPFSGYSSGFGGRFHPVLEQRKFHYGLDFVAKIGTSVLAPGDGIVEYAGFNSGGFGNLIILSHNFGFKTYFAHLSEIDVKVGDYITKGTVIGKTGNTGRSSGPHLHYEIHYLGKRMDPKNFAKWSLENYDYIFKNEKGVKWQSLIEMTKLQTQIIQQKNPDANDLYLKVLESSHIQEEEYFFHTIHSDWDNIIRTIRENHEHAAESAPIKRPMSNDKKVQRFLQTLKFKSNPIEEFWRFFCDEMQIPFDHLSVDEHKVMKDVFKRSKLLKALPNRKKSKK